MRYGCDTTAGSGTRQRRKTAARVASRRACQALLDQQAEWRSSATSSGSASWPASASPSPDLTSRLTRTRYGARYPRSVRRWSRSRRQVDADTLGRVVGASRKVFLGVGSYVHSTGGRQTRGRSLIRPSGCDQGQLLAAPSPAQDESLLVDARSRPRPVVAPAGYRPAGANHR